jgi:hypothetical protein
VGQEIKTETRKAPPAKPLRKRRDGHPRDAAPLNDSSEDQTPPENVSATNIAAEEVSRDSQSEE